MTASYNLSQLGSHYNQGGTGAVDRTTASKLQESVSVLDFGADPTGVSDSTTAIQNAINAAYGNSVLFPPGNYLISSSLSITAPINLTGAMSARQSTTNYGARIFTNTAALAQLLNIQFSATAGNDSSGGVISNLTFDGNSNAAICVLIQGANTTKMSFNKCVFRSATNIGVNITGNHSFCFYSCMFTLNGSGLTTNSGVQLNGGNVCNFYGCNFEANNGRALNILAGYCNNVFGGAVEGNYLSGIYGSSTGQHVSIQGIDFEQNNTSSTAGEYDIAMTGSAAYWDIKNTHHSGTTVTAAIWNNALQNSIENFRSVSGKLVLWTANAYNGIFIGDVTNGFDASSVVQNYVQVINSSAQGMGVTTPSFPASNTAQTNTLFCNVLVIIVTAGGSTAYTFIDGAGRTQAIAAALTPGQTFVLPPGWGFKASWATTSPTWKWATI